MGTGVPVSPRKLAAAGWASSASARQNRVVLSTRTRRVVVAIGVASIALMVGGLVLLFIDRDASIPSDLQPNVASWTPSDVLDAAVNFGTPLLGMLLVLRKPENRIGWLFLLVGLVLGIGLFAGAYATHALIVDPGSVPGGRLAGWIANVVWPLPFSALVLLFLWFPTGEIPSRRWRPVEVFTFGLFGMLTVLAVITSTQSWSNPFTTGETGGGLAHTTLIVLFLVAVVAVPITILAAFVSSAVRFKGSTGEERLQLKWFATAAGFTAIIFAIQVPFGGDSVTLSVLTDVGLLFLYVAIARAILKYRLYEIDVVIGRTVVFTTLVAFITVVYVGLVVGVGTLVGNARSPLLSAIAAALVAVAFQPVRQWARRLANRVVYGKRATPYEVLTDFTARASETYSTEDVLPRMARILADGVGATEARVWLRVGAELRPAATWPVDGAVEPVPISGPDGFAFTEPERAFPVRYAGELLGAISVITPPAEPLQADREQLLSDVASQAALVLRNVRLIEELRESRRRIVAAQDERAKALERNLHDGAQQQLVALAVKQRLAESLVDRDPERAKVMLGEIQTETQEALETLRDLARGIYPPLLADRGLGAALEAQARKAAVPVRVECTGIGRYPQEIESVAYFCSLEALQNVTKYANATNVVIRSYEADGRLVFEIEDDGSGFDPGATTYGTGLQGMADRLDAVRGTLTVQSVPGQGTTIVGKLPVPATEEAATFNS
jgi:signal transduction histidine kinase